MVLFTSVIFKLAICNLLLAQDFFYGLSAKLCDLLNGTKLSQAVHSSLYAVGGIVGAIALGTDILDAYHFQHRTGRAAGDNASTFLRTWPLPNLPSTA